MNCTVTLLSLELYLNYLAHIQLARISNTSMLGNFLGDFVKGNDLTHLPIAIQQGIRLHRSIDTFTDSHPQVVAIKKESPKNLRRMMGVVIDMYFDHLLCTHWSHFNEHSLSTTTGQFYQELATQNVPVSGRFLAVKEGLLQHRWLEDYQALNACERGFYSIEKRLNGKVQFAKQASIYIEQESSHLQDAFLAFYPALMAHTLRYVNAAMKQD